MATGTTVAASMGEASEAAAFMAAVVEEGIANQRSSSV
jgi:hypothetical protein